MRICPKCGAGIVEGNAFCIGCGTFLPDASEEVELQTPAKAEVAAAQDSPWDEGTSAGRADAPVYEPAPVLEPMPVFEPEPELKPENSPWQVDEAQFKSTNSSENKVWSNTKDDLWSPPVATSTPEPAPAQTSRPQYASDPVFQAPPEPTHTTTQSAPSPSSTPTRTQTPSTSQTNTSSYSNAAVESSSLPKKSSGGCCGIFMTLLLAYFLLSLLVGCVRGLASCTRSSKAVPNVVATTMVETSPRGAGF